MYSILFNLCMREIRGTVPWHRQSHSSIEKNRIHLVGGDDTQYYFVYVIISRGCSNPVADIKIV